MREKKRVGIYARVSTADQTPESQVLDLHRYAVERGWDAVRVYVDHGVSGTKDSRPSLDTLMDDARKRKLDVVLVWRFDRFARSTKHLVLALEEFQSLGVDFVSYCESIDTTSPLGKAIFVIVSAVAQLERDIIAERVRAGLRRAKANGTKLGRPVSVDPDEIWGGPSQENSALLTAPSGTFCEVDGNPLQIERLQLTSLLARPEPKTADGKHYIFLHLCEPNEPLAASS